MADKTAPTARTWWERLSWPQVVALAILVTGVILAGVLVPLEKLETIPWEQGLGLALLLAGVAGVAGTKPALDLTGVFARRPERVSRPPSSSSGRREGFLDLEAACGIVGLAALALVAGLVFGGCGASALQTQARFQLVAGVTLGAAGDVEQEIRRAELAECVAAARESQDRTTGEACVLDVERRHAPFHAAHDSSRSVLLGWVEIAELADRAGGDEDLVLPAVQAGARWALTYDDVAEALRQLGAEAPPLPPLLRDGLSAVGGAR